jgi:zinc transport system ATP-binding protein
MKIVELHDTSYYMGNRIIIDKVNFSLSTGKIVSIIGPNGSGKSTIAKLICQIKLPTDGKITRKNNLTIAYVPQKFSVDKFFPINLEYFLQINQLSAQKCNKLLTEFNLEDKLKSQLSNLSGGEMQRLLLVLALSSQSDLLLLDEPTQYLDIDGQVKLYKIIEEHAKLRNQAVLIISHDLYMVMKSSDHVICLNQHICCQGTAGDVQSNTKFHNLYGNTVLDFITPYTHHHNHTHGSV